MKTIEELAREADSGFGNDDGDMPDALVGLPAITRFVAAVRREALEEAASKVRRILLNEEPLTFVSDGAVYETQQAFLAAGIASAIMSLQSPPSP